MALTTAITTSVLVRAFLVGKMVCSRAKASYAGTGSITSTHGLELTVAGASAGMKTPLETKPPTMHMCTMESAWPQIPAHAPILPPIAFAAARILQVSTATCASKFMCVKSSASHKLFFDIRKPLP
jgi:hypothetical protein